MFTQKKFLSLVDSLNTRQVVWRFNIFFGRWYGVSISSSVVRVILYTNIQASCGAGSDQTKNEGEPADEGAGRASAKRNDGSREKSRAH